ncbi:ATP synthase F0 subunit B [Botrimarina hoheduenensis]|uniref:ATP synthase subunit b n=1 Tax=Botrimarina hoheduenensis TaxID=2528000 RepID=A0A5C5WFJ9_9BACT|nr:ATP synthase F0 subunit B [Botrimarina hoheduenensis]TWT48853.1 ATP synthase subunit b precursor [Botrimarina hoheduenensis]
MNRIMIDRCFLTLVFALALSLGSIGNAVRAEESETVKPAAADSAEADAEAAGADDTHDAAAHDHADADAHAAKGGPDPLATDPDLAIWTFVVFLAMLAILSQVAWKPIMDGLQAREDGIAGNLAAADQKHEEAKALLVEHQAKLAGAADEVRALLEEARRDADATIAQAKADAKAVAESERLRAVREIEQARDVAVRQLAERSAGLAIDLAAKVVRQDISAERQAELVRDALGRFSEAGPSSN